jgi:hypothetical protein
LLKEKTQAYAWKSTGKILMKDILKRLAIIVLIFLTHICNLSNGRAFSLAQGIKIYPEGLQ